MVLFRAIAHNLAEGTFQNPPPLQVATLEIEPHLCGPAPRCRNYK
jgi:hypothetical protein